jgi:broad specificity phosphatase PhoE
MELTILRHGKTESNLINTWFNGDFDGNLTPEGIDQAKAAGERLKGEEYDIIFTSSLKRTQQTADIINNMNGASKEIVVDERLVELKPGVFGGLSISEIMETYSQIFEKRKANKFQTPIPEGESYKMVYDRLYNFINDIYGNFKDKRVLLITHATTIKLFLLLLTEMSLEEIEKQKFDYTCIFKFDIKKIGYSYLGKETIFNCMSHLTK